MPVVMAASRTDSRCDPDGRRSSETAHRVAPDEDKACTKEPNPSDNLGGDPRRVEDDPSRFENVVESVLADQHEERGTDADQGVRPQTGALLTHLSFETYERGQQQGQSKLAHLAPPLNIR